MTQWQNQVEKQYHGKPFPEVLISGEGAFPEKPFTPPSSCPDLPLDLPPAGHRSFSANASGWPG